MTDSIFKAMIAHFETGHDTLRIMDKEYELWPQEPSNFIVFIKDTLTGDRDVLSRDTGFDEACMAIARSVELDIASYWEEGKTRRLYG